jgi:hypothetical protein
MTPVMVICVLCERILEWVIEDVYNYYLTLFIYKLRNYLHFLKTF